MGLSVTDHISHDSVSVVRTTFKVHGKRQTLTLSQPKTPELIVTKFEVVITSWTPTTKKNLGSIRPGVFAPHIGEIYTPPVRNLLHFFRYLNSLRGESIRPIFTLNTLNDVVLCKEVPFYCYRIKILLFTYLFEKFKKITLAPMGKI